MPTRRDRVMDALAFRTPDQVPKDLGGMLSTCISCFAYPKLVAALGLPPRRPRVFDTGQMLALPDVDVLDALDCDVVFVCEDHATDAFDEPARWHDYDFNGRLPARVMNPQSFAAQPDGSILQHGVSRMVLDSYVFDSPHAGEELNLTGDIRMEDLKALARQLKEPGLTDERITAIRDYCLRVRESTDRAIMFSGLYAGIGFRGGMANFSILCLTEPDYVRELHELLIAHSIARARLLLPAIAPYVDVLMLAADDQGTQNSSILPPATYGDLFTPYYRRLNDEVHRLAPDVRTFYHCCGAVYDLLDHIIAGGFDAFNPVQWCAGKHSYQEWKDRCRGRLTLWGGGINTQVTLPLGTVKAVEREAAEVVPYLAADGGYVFCAIHNLLAEISPEKVIALYRTAGRAGRPGVRGRPALECGASAPLSGRGRARGRR